MEEVEEDLVFQSLPQPRQYRAKLFPIPLVANLLQQVCITQGCIWGGGGGGLGKPLPPLELHIVSDLLYTKVRIHVASPPLEFFNYIILT